MAAASNPGLRRSLAVVLILALTLAGLGRALTGTVSAGSAPMSIIGIDAPICHSGAGGGSDGPGRDASHGCCDHCALPAPAVLPAPPSLAGPTGTARHADPAFGSNWTLAVPPARIHRLPRGPPTA